VKFSEAGHVIHRIPVWVSQAKTILFREGPLNLFKRGFRKLYRFVFFRGDPHRMHRFNYGDWMKNIEARYLNHDYMEKLGKKLSVSPTFSIIMPVWNKPVAMIEQALSSILAQKYKNWEICISDGSSENIDETVLFLKEFQNKHKDKVKLRFLSDDVRQRINIIENRNNCLDMAEGEYCVIMDCDDELSENCLLELAWEIEKHPDAAFIYSDFDKIDLKGERSDPSFWPDWSPHTILSMMYTTHVRCIRTEIFRELGGVREGTEGADDWDLVLHLAEKVEPNQIQHIPKILYHWRIYPGSTAMSNSGAKNWAYDNQKKVLEDWLQRNEEKGEVVKGSFEGAWRVKFAIRGNPKISVIIPFKDGVSYTKRCVSSIEEKTTYDNYDIVLVDNQSEEVETKEYLAAMSMKHIVLSYDKPYSFGKLNNWAASQVNGDHILLLNNDTEVINGEWMSAMLEYSQRDEVGAVGGKLLYPDGRIQHAGVIVGLGGAAAHSHRLLDSRLPGYNGWTVNVMNFLAVTAACLMIKRELFLEEMGGFLPEFDPAYQDVDLGIRLYEAGYWNVFTPYARLYHFESATRFSSRNKEKLTRDEENAEKLRKKWSKYVDIDFCDDPFYNPNLSSSHEDFRLKNTWYPEEWGERIGLVV
jgi:O-antigen biosynthesis protein